MSKNPAGHRFRGPLLTQLSLGAVCASLDFDSSFAGGLHGMRLKMVGLQELVPRGT